MVFALKTAHNGKYLRFRREEIISYGLLQTSADQVEDLYAQFEFLTSDTYVGLVHIRCRYNNKYLVRWSPTHYWLMGAADKPNEDKNDWACTLFERIDLDDDASTRKLRLKHVQLDHYACVWRIGDLFDDCLFAGKKEVDENSMDVFTFVNLDKLFSPVSKLVAFKGDNGKYLGAHMHNGIDAYLQFSYDNPDDPKAIHEMFSTPHGIFFIRSNYYGKFWLCDNGNWIRADCDNPRANVAAMFRTVPLGINVGIISMETQLMLRRYTMLGFESCLNATIPEIDQWVTLQMIELGSTN